MDINKYEEIFSSITPDNLPEQLLKIRSLVEEDSNNEKILNNRITDLQKMNMDLFTRATTTVVESSTPVVEENPEEELDKIINIIKGKKEE